MDTDATSVFKEKYCTLQNISRSVAAAPNATELNVVDDVSTLLFAAGFAVLFCDAAIYMNRNCWKLAEASAPAVKFCLITLQLFCFNSSSIILPVQAWSALHQGPPLPRPG